jgi:hypothetical protein
MMAQEHAMAGMVSCFGTLRSYLPHLSPCQIGGWYLDGGEIIDFINFMSYSNLLCMKKEIMPVTTMVPNYLYSQLP